MYFTSGGDRAFEQLMQQRPGADHFDSGDAERRRIAATAAFTAPTEISVLRLRRVSLPAGQAHPPLTR